MNNLLIIKKSLAFSMTSVLTLVMLSSLVGSARAQENRVAPGRDVLAASSQGQGPTDPAFLLVVLFSPPWLFLLGRWMKRLTFSPKEVV